MTRPSLRSALMKGPVLGTWSLIPSPTVHELFATGGMDFVILDMEHGPYGITEVEAGVRACAATKCRALVRVPSLDGALIQTVLDTGAEGIVVPRVGTAAEATQAVAATRFPPDGTRGFNPFTRGNGYDPKNTPGEKAFVCIIVEDKQACTEATLAEILAVPGLDAVYVGAYDLSVSLGHPGEVTHPDVAAVVERCVLQIQRAGKTAGMMARSEESMKRALTLGATMLAWSVDTDVVRTAAAGPAEMLKKLSPSARP